MHAIYRLGASAGIAALIFAPSLTTRVFGQSVVKAGEAATKAFMESAIGKRVLTDLAESPAGQIVVSKFAHILGRDSPAERGARLLLDPKMSEALIKQLPAELRPTIEGQINTLRLALRPDVPLNEQNLLADGLSSKITSDTPIAVCSNEGCQPSFFKKAISGVGVAAISTPSGLVAKKLCQDSHCDEKLATSIEGLVDSAVRFHEPPSIDPGSKPK
jgi:hypothetical protein